MICKLVYKEILHRKFNFVVGLLTMTMGVALFVSFFTMSTASNRETIRLTRDMGFNLRIIPKETDMNRFWMEGYSNITMPEEYAKEFMNFKDFSFAHVTAILHQRITWNNMEIIMTGIGKELEPSGVKKSPMIFSIDPGTIYVGFDIAKTFSIMQGDEIKIKGRNFKVMRTLSESGSIDDIRLYGTLTDIQDISRNHGKINEIKALNCLCLSDEEKNPLDVLREQLNRVLPDASVLMNTTIAEARERQRRMVERYFAFILPTVLITMLICLGSLAMMNVRARKKEIGILRALGYGSTKISGLFIWKSVFIGVFGAVLGFILGTVVSLIWGPGIFKVTAASIQPIFILLLWSLIFAPIFSSLASFIPMTVAVTQDPAQILLED